MHIELQSFNVLTFAPYSPTLETIKPPVLSVDPLSIDAALEELSPTLDIPVDKSICPDGVLTVSIKRMADFKPKNIHRAAPFINEIKEAQDFLQQGGSAENLENLFPRVAALISIPEPTAISPRNTKASAIDDILAMVDTDTGESRSPKAAAKVDEQLRGILEKAKQAVFENTNFRSMEAAWRGAALIASQVTSGSKAGLNMKLVPLPQGDCIPVIDMLEDLLADSPPDLIIFDMELSNSPRAMAILERIMDFAEAMLAPAAVALGPEFFGISSWGELKKVRYIPGLLEGAEYGRWKTLVQKSGAGWTVPSIGGILARSRYTRDHGNGGYGFAERDYLWASAPWAIGALCAGSAATYGSPTRFCDRDYMRLEGLALTEGPFPSPLEPVLETDRRRDFKQAGILTLAGVRDRDQVFITGSTTMDGGPLKFRLFLSRVIGFLIRLSQSHRDEIQNLEADLQEAVSLFIQTAGFAAPEDLKVVAHEKNEGYTPLEISFTPDYSILSAGSPISFGFNW